MNLENSLTEAALNWDEDQLKKLCKDALSTQNITPEALLKMIGNIMHLIGQKYESGEFFLPELIGSSNAVKIAIEEVIDPVIKAVGSSRKTLGKIILGTVEGDVHSIGKDLVASFLFANGFDVINLGVEIPAQVFIEKAEQEQAQIIGLSALLSISMAFQRQVIEELKKHGLREKYKVIIGGSPTSPGWAEEIGADGWADDAIEAVEVVKKILQIK
jgi:methylmalonyl-CoA mutase cobalamin-binding domain/chain